MNSRIIRLGLIGTGFVAAEHVKVIEENHRAEVVGLTSRTHSTAEAFAKKHGLPRPYTNITEMVSKAKPDALMVMVSSDNMHTASKEALSFGLPVFMEKPAGLTPGLNLELADIADRKQVKTMVGFNRRFYSIFHKGVEIIKEHGPLYGLLIEGHERINAVRAAGRFSGETIENWIYANSTHTIDLLSFFGGKISKIKGNASSWREPGGDQFSASIQFENGAIGTYVSNWLSPGGWRIVLYGKGVSVEFKPLEKGVWTDSNFKTHDILPDKYDEMFKPGFYQQLDSFLDLIAGKEIDHIQDLRGALRSMELATAISGNVINNVREAE